MQRRVISIRTGIAGNQMQAGDRYIEFRAAGVFQHQEFAGFAFNGNGFQALIAANAMVYMNHRRANA